MTDFVRVKDNETGHHYTVTRERYDSDPSLWTELKQAATNPADEPLPPKYKTTISTETADKKAGSTATDKENH
jgi:hypothetical protein